MFESKKSNKLIMDQSHRGNSHPCQFDTSIKEFRFTANNFQICFEYEGTQKNEDIVIIEQLLRFEEVLPFLDWSRLTFREFESFLRDVNSSQCVETSKLKKAQELFNFWKDQLAYVVRVKQGLDIIKQNIGTIRGLDFIDSCLKISKGFKDLHRSGLLEYDAFYKIHEFNLLKSELIIAIDSSFVVAPDEVELLRLLSESIEGVNIVKMVARES